MLTVTSAAVVACVLTPAAGATTMSGPQVVQEDPKEEEKCPDGEPKPCAASDKDRESVDSDREDAEKDIAAAKEDIAAAKDKADDCPPGTAEGKECMKNLIGDGAEQQEGLDKVQAELDSFQAAPTDNAASALASTCDAFAADLPAIFKVDDGSSSLTGLCELMNQ
ncbi:hypothetical protein [Herbidospora sp. RD11066]